MHLGMDIAYRFPREVIRASWARLERTKFPQHVGVALVRNAEVVLNGGDTPFRHVLEVALDERTHFFLIRRAVKLVYLRQETFLRRPRATSRRVKLHYLL